MDFETAISFTQKILELCGIVAPIALIVSLTLKIVVKNLSLTLSHCHIMAKKSYCIYSSDIYPFLHRQLPNIIRTATNKLS